MNDQKIISPASLTLLAEGLGFGEGPLWHKEGFLIFSDVRYNRIMKLKDGQLHVFLDESGWKGTPTEEQSDQPGANGLAYDLEGKIVCCQHGSHAIGRIESDGSIETVVDSYQGKRLNSPNDLCVGPDGSIYFTDPPYGLKEQRLHPEIAQSFAGVYRWFNGMLELLTTEFEYPNGICFSPDYRYLYIGSNHPAEKRIRRYELAEGKLLNGSTFVEENADGIKTDREGNLYLATMTGVKIFSATGEQISFIPIPEMTTNLCLHGKHLYITTERNVYECLLTR